MNLTIKKTVKFHNDLESGIIWEFYEQLGWEFRWTLYSRLYSTFFDKLYWKLDRNLNGLRRSLNESNN